jgi:hypothetical protein
MSEPVIPDETERLRIFLREARDVQDQLRADKAELLAVLKSNIMHGSEAYHDRVEAEAHRIIAKHEAQDAS